MTQGLRVEIMDFEGRMVYMTCWIRTHEKCVVVNVRGPTVYVTKERDVFLLAIALDIQPVRRNYIKMFGVPAPHCVKVFGT